MIKLPLRYIENLPIQDSRGLPSLHFHPKSTKQAIVTSLQNRATVICSNEDDLRKEYQQKASTLTANGYPQNILTKKHRKIDNHTAQEKPTGTAIIPYAPGISEKLRRMGNKYGIRTAFRSSTTFHVNVGNDI